MLLPLAIALLAASGCPRTCPTCVPDTQRSFTTAFCGNADADTFRKIVDAFEKAEGQPEILMLSGGGSYGAWGAGILNGWSPAARPSFELVTGSSTGSILGTWAFIGPRADANAKAAYTETDDADVYIRTFPWLWLQPWRWGSIKPWVSVKNLTPLRTLFEKRTPVEQVREVGRIYRDEGRVFIVGTVDIDLGTFCLWDMGKLAARMLDVPKDGPQEREIYERYREIVMASSSNPVVFDPTYLDGTMHVDGGVRHQIFLYQALSPWIQEGFSKALSHAAEKHAEAPRLMDCNAASPHGHPRIYAVLNGPMVVPRVCTREDVYHVGQRSITVMEIQAMIGNLYQAKALFAPRFGTDEQVDFCLSHIPDEVSVWPFADDFPKYRMRELYAEAEKRASAGSSWTYEIPRGGASPRPCEDPGPISPTTTR